MIVQARAHQEQAPRQEARGHQEQRVAVTAQVEQATHQEAQERQDQTEQAELLSQGMAQTELVGLAVLRDLREHPPHQINLVVMVSREPQDLTQRAVRQELVA